MALKDLLVPGLLVIALCIFISPSESQNAPPPDCSKCNKTWLGSLEKYNKNGMLSLKTDGGLCKLAQREQLFTPCKQGNTCDPIKEVTLTCCPVECVSTIMQCYKGNSLQTICIPDSINKWMTEITKIVKAEKTQNKTSAG